MNANPEINSGSFHAKSPRYQFISWIFLKKLKLKLPLNLQVVAKLNNCTSTVVIVFKLYIF